MFYRVLGQLPKQNHLLLIHFLCVLYHIARRSCHTLMSAANLGVCVGPSLLWSDCPNVGDDLRVVPSVVECLITHCEYLCGSHVPSLLGDLRDSGTEESDCKYLRRISLLDKIIVPTLLTSNFVFRRSHETRRFVD